jgi:cold shock CspA family protein
MTGRIIRLVDHEQVGTISADDGDDYAFHASALSQGRFKDLSLGTPVSFEPILAHGARRATLVRVLTK